MSARTDSSLHPAIPESHRGFWSLIATQAQGAFSDNALKNLVILLILGEGLSNSAKNDLVPVVLVLFSLPFIFFSMAGGWLADRFSKRRVTINTKVMEVCVALVALAGLWMANMPLMLAAIFLFSTQAALFGPTKYGLIPELLPARELSWGNGVLESGTFLAILTGTIAAGYLSEYFHGRQEWSGFVLIGLALLGLATSVGVSRIPAADPMRRLQLNFLADLLRALSVMREDRLLLQAVMGNTFFWFLGGLLQPVIILYGKETLRLSDSHNTWLQAALAIGVGLGSLAAGYLSSGEIEYGLVPIGALGLTAMWVWIGASPPAFRSILWELSALGFSAGLFSVPVLALTQHRPRRDQRGLVLAATNLLSFVGIFLAGGAYYLLINVFRLSMREVFFTGAGMTLIATIYALAAVQGCVKRMNAWLRRAARLSLKPAS